MKSKKSKLLLSLCTLMFCIGVMCFGVYAATSVSYTLSGHITYDVNDVFVDIDTTLYASNKDLYTSQSNIAEDMHSISSALESGASVPSANLDEFSYVDHQSSLNNVGDGEMSYVAKALDLNYGSYVADTTSYAYYLAITISNYADETISAILDLDILYDLNTNVIITPERTMENIPAGTSDSPSKVCLVFGLILDNPANSIDVSFDGVNLSVNKGELQETPGLSFTAIDNGEAYSVSSGTANAERLVIPAYHEGKPVTTANIGVAYGGDYRSTTPWKEIYFPNTLTTITDYGVTSSPNLRYVYLPQSITNIGSCFLDVCESVKTLYIPENVVSYSPEKSYQKSIYENLYSLFVSNDNAILSSQDSVLYNEDKSTVYKCAGKKVGDVELPSTITSIAKNAFSCCQFTAVTYSTSGEGYTFENGTLTITGDISDSPTWYSANINPLVINVVYENSEITSIGSYAFYGCSSLKEITIPNSVVSIGSNSFYGCKFKSVIYSTSGEGYIFENGTLTVTANISDNPAWRSANMNPLITKVVFSDGSVTSIGSNAFSGCTSLTSITISEGVGRIGDYAFNGCTSLTSITIPSSVGSVGGNAFLGCVALNTVYIDSKDAIPPYPGAIGYLFYYLTTGGKVYVLSTLENVGGYLSSSNYFEKAEGTVTVGDKTYVCYNYIGA